MGDRALVWFPWSLIRLCVFSWGGLLSESSHKWIHCFLLLFVSSGTWNLHPAYRGVDANRLLWSPKHSGGLTDPGWVKLRYQLMRWYQSYPVMIYFGFFFFCQFALYSFVLLSWYLPMLPRLFWISPASILGETSDMTFTNFTTPF